METEESVACEGRLALLLYYRLFLNLYINFNSVHIHTFAYVLFLALYTFKFHSFCIIFGVQSPMAYLPVVHPVLWVYFSVLLFNEMGQSHPEPARVNQSQLKSP